MGWPDGFWNIGKNSRTVFFQPRKRNPLCSFLYRCSPFGIPGKGKSSPPPIRAGSSSFIVVGAAFSGSRPSARSAGTCVPGEGNRACWFPSFQSAAGSLPASRYQTTSRGFGACRGRHPVYTRSSHTAPERKAPRACRIPEWSARCRWVCGNWYVSPR